MNWTKKIYGARMVLLASLATLFGVVNMSQQQVSASPDDELKIGGQLYDNWPKITGAKLQGNHPLYPEAGKKSGMDTWRCKECHGWDYIGKDGRYMKGSHYTGIAGVLSKKEKATDQLQKSIVSGPNGHDFSQYINEAQAHALARFVKEGTFDMSAAISPEGKVMGDAQAGATLFADKCASCHGDDGNKYDFEKDDGVQGISYLANDNPQETMHKILWGNPGTDMPSLITDEGLTLTEAQNILSFAQTLK